MEGKKIAGQGKKQEEKLAQGWLKENQGRSEASFNRNFSYSEFIYIYTIYLKLKRSDGRRMIRKVEPRKDSCGSITDDSKKPLDRKLRRNFSHKMIPSILRGRRARKKKKEQITTTKGKKERKKENGTKEGKRGEYLSAFTVGEVADRNVTRGRTCKRVIRFSGAGVSLRDSLCGQIWPRSPIVIIFWFSNVCHMAQLLAGAGPERLPMPPYIPIGAAENNDSPAWKPQRREKYMRRLHEMLFWQKTQCRGCVWRFVDPLSSPDPRTLRAVPTNLNVDARPNNFGENVTYVFTWNRFSPRRNASIYVSLDRDIVYTR